MFCAPNRPIIFFLIDVYLKLLLLVKAFELTKSLLSISHYNSSVHASNAKRGNFDFLHVIMGNGRGFHQDIFKAPLTTAYYNYSEQKNSEF